MKRICLLCKKIQNNDIFISDNPIEWFCRECYGVRT